MIRKFTISFILLLSIINFQLSIPIVLAAHCDPSGNFTSLNSYCDPATNTIWQDEADCTHTNTGVACTSTPSLPTCSYSETCDAGSGPASGEHSCTGTNPNEAGQNQCGYNSTVDPACTACTAKTPPAPVTPPAPAPPTANSTTNATTNATSPESPEEAAIRHQDEGLRPPSDQIPAEVIERPRIIQAVGDFFSGFGSLLNSLLRMAAFIQDSRGLERSELPQEQVSNETKPNLVIDDAFGGDTQKGIYNVTLPEIFPTPTPVGINVVAENKPINDSEDNNSVEQEFEKSYLPEWCKKITTGECNIPYVP